MFELFRQTQNPTTSPKPQILSSSRQIYNARITSNLTLDHSIMSYRSSALEKAYNHLPRLTTADQETRRKAQITRDAVALYKSRGGCGEPDQKTKDAFMKEAVDNHIANIEKNREGSA